MKTGFYIRFERNGKRENLDIADLTNEEFRKFLQSQTFIEAQSWALALHQWIVDKYFLQSDRSDHEMD